MKLVLHAGALRELREAMEWYAAQGAAERGLRLARMVDVRLHEIAKAHESFPRDERRTWARRARILRWPYTLVFAVQDETIVVLAVAHGKRRPGYWAKRRPR
jgi:plasmid stabilization system protein ParE